MLRGWRKLPSFVLIKLLFTSDCCVALLRVEILLCKSFYSIERPTSTTNQIKRRWEKKFASVYREKFLMNKKSQIAHNHIFPQMDASLIGNREGSGAGGCSLSGCHHPRELCYTLSFALCRSNSNSSAAKWENKGEQVTLDCCVWRRTKTYHVELFKLAKLSNFRELNDTREEKFH